MDLRHINASTIGLALDRAGISWFFDHDGDVRVRFRSGNQPWMDAIFLELQPDFAIRGEFLNATRTELPNGKIAWEAQKSGPPPVALAQKIVSVYIIPDASGFSVQIHATITILGLNAPAFVKISPSKMRIGEIQDGYPGFFGRGDGTNAWISSGIEGENINDSDFASFLGLARDVGLRMFEREFSGQVSMTDF